MSQACHTEPMAQGNRLLLLMRHAEAVNLAPGLGDADRPLTDAGREQARRVGAYLAEHDIRVGTVLCSASARTRETAALLECAAPTQQSEAIYNAGSDTIREVITTVDDEVSVLLVVGHAPGVPTLAHTLTDRAASAPEDVLAIERGFPPATLVGIELAGSWADPTPGRIAFVVRG